ncbi:hypothetical protein JCM8547_008107 [Rhodosporidiobolus lusitaniae]
MSSSFSLDPLLLDSFSFFRDPSRSVESYFNLPPVESTGSTSAFRTNENAQSSGSQAKQPQGVEQPKEQRPPPPQHKPFHHVEPKKPEETIVLQDEGDWLESRTRKKRFSQDSVHGASPPRNPKKERTRSPSRAQDSARVVPVVSAQSSSLSSSTPTNKPALSPSHSSAGKSHLATPDFPSFVAPQPSLSHPKPRHFAATLTQDVLFPSLRGLTLSAYAPYLTSDLVEIPWSSAYYNAVNEFLESCSAPQIWRSKPGGGPRDCGPFSIVRTLLTYQPNKEAIKRMTTFASNKLPGSLRKQPRDRRFLPIYILLREHASTLRYSDAVHIAQRELLSHLTLSPFAALFAREQRARVLLKWLNQQPKRWYMFFCKPDEAVRPKSPEGKGSWEWWMREPRVGEVHSKAELDEWERGVMRVEEWRNQ